MAEEPEERICTRCGTKCTEECPACLKVFHNRKNADTMTGDERAEEMNYWITCEIGPKLTQQRIEELVGRRVSFFIEVGQNWTDLIEEARTREHPENIIEHLKDLDPLNKIRDIVIT